MEVFQYTYMYILLLFAVLEVLRSDYTCDKTICPQEQPLCTPAGCVARCPENSFEKDGACVLNCVGGVVDDNKCRDECPADKTFTVDEIVVRGGSFYSIRFCYESCEIDNFHFFYDNTCVVSCPLKALLVENQKCTPNCSTSYPLKLELVTSSNHAYIECVNRCPRQKSMVRNQTCVSHCEDDEVVFHGTCLAKCPNGSYVVHNKECMTHCPKETFYHNGRCTKMCPSKEFNGTCVQDCPESFPLSLQDRVPTCIKKCPAGMSIKNYTCEYCRDQLYNNTCVETCPPDMPFSYSLSVPYWPRANHCLKHCPRLSYTMNFTCVKFCPRGLKHYNRTCVEMCPLVMPLSFDELKFRGVIFCLKQCPIYSYTMNLTCVTICPQSLKAYNRTCVETCPSEMPFSYDELELYYKENSCLQQCPENAYTMNFTCMSSCPQNFKAYNRTCVETCPSTSPFSFVFNRSFEHMTSFFYPYKYLYYNLSNLCLKRCPENSYTTNFTCLSSCKGLLYDDMCVDVCPVDKPFVEKNRVCVEKCSDGRLSKGSTCIERSKCTDPIIYDTMCLDACPNGMYWVGYSVTEGSCLSRWIIYGIIVGSILLMVAVHLVCAKFFRLQPFSCCISFWKRAVKVSDEMLCNALAIVDTGYSASTWSKLDPGVQACLFVCSVPVALLVAIGSAGSAVSHHVNVAVVISMAFGTVAFLLCTCITSKWLKMRERRCITFTTQHSYEGLAKLQKKLHTEVTRHTYTTGVLFDIYVQPARKLKCVRETVVKYLTNKIAEKLEEKSDLTDGIEMIKPEDIAEGMIWRRLLELGTNLTILPDAPVNRHNVKGGKACFCQMLEGLILTECLRNKQPRIGREEKMGKRLLQTEGQRSSRQTNSDEEADII